MSVVTWVAIAGRFQLAKDIYLSKSLVASVSLHVFLQSPSVLVCFPDKNMDVLVSKGRSSLVSVCHLSGFLGVGPVNDTLKFHVSVSSGLTPAASCSLRG